MDFEKLQSTPAEILTALGLFDTNYPVVPLSKDPT